ncbi:MAG: PQQ-dependent sugar dehydrogenase [Solirubrobacteraceae bacterium]
MKRGSFAAVLVATMVLGGCGSDDADKPDRRGTTQEDGQRGAPAQSGVKLTSIGTFNEPVYVTSPPGDKRRVFVVERPGTIRVIRGGKRVSRPFLDLKSRVISGGEQGLLSMAFAPDYRKTRRFYVNYTDKQGTQSVVEFKRSKSKTDRAIARGRLLLRYDDEEGNHNGGLVLFGPDKLLYIGTGDGGGADDQHGARGNAQNLDSLLGKLLRINPRKKGTKRYSVPGDNPFVGRRGADEIYSYGLRNPWRFSFDRATGDLTIGDVGQNAREEIDFARKGQARGANYGWRPWEGTARNYPGESAPGHVRPVLELDHNGGNCSVTGGHVVRDPKLTALAGRYVYGDFCKGQLRSVRLSSSGASDDRSLGLKTVPSLSSFGEDARRRVYVVSLDGPVYRLSP